MYKKLTILTLSFVLPIATTFAQSSKVEPPKVVGTPPSDAGRGLMRVSANEIRHYNGIRPKKVYMVSKDNGLTWSNATAPESYPKNFGGMNKEAPAFAQNPITKQWIRIQPINSIVFISDTSDPDGTWKAVTKDGKLTDKWESDQSNLIRLSGITRSPYFVNNGKRILVPGHSTHAGTWTHISDDGGLTWTKSKTNVKSPTFQIVEPHKGHRWRNDGVEGTIVELKDGRLWIIVRTSLDQYWESYSDDFGTTWAPAQASRFFGTITMPTVGRLQNGGLIMLWTNTMALPERKSGKTGGEDAFTNRDSQHAAVSYDEGKTWRGFREVALDEYRNESDYATSKGHGDRGKHQSEFVNLDKNHILLTAGQHPSHRRFIILDTRWLLEKTRSNNFSNGLDDWTHHTFIPKRAGHCAYNRKPSATLIDNPHKPGAKAMLIKRLDDPTLVNVQNEVDYQNAGATWNFPNGEKGKVTIQFTLNEGSEGAQFSLTDRLFNACDETTKLYAIYTLPISIGKTFKPNVSYKLTLEWNGVKSEKNTCKISVNGKNIGKIKLNKTSPNGISYFHLISNAKNADTGIIIESIKAEVK